MRISSSVSKTVVLSLLPLSWLVSPVAMAAEAIPFTVSAAKQENVALTLDVAIEKAFSNSADLKRKRLAAEYGDLEYRLKKNDAKAVAEDTILTLKIARTKYEDPAKYYKEARLAYYNMKDLERKLKLDTSTAYYDAVHAKAMGDDAGLDEALKKLNKLIGAKPDQTWNLAPKEERAEYTLPALEEAIQLAAQNRPDVMKCKSEQDYAKERIEIVSRWSFIGSIEGRMVANKAALAEMDYNDCYKVAVADVTKNYDALKAASEKATSAKESLDKDDKHPGEAYLNAVHEYNLALATYLYALGL